EQLQIAEGILDLLALVEADAPDDAIGQARAHQRVFDDARLRVHPIKDGHRAVRLAADAGVGGPRDEVRFFQVVRSAKIPDALATLALGPQPLFLAVAVHADHR